MRVKISAAAASTTLLAACATGGFTNPAGVRVEGAGDVIAFTWDAEHPWARQFQSQTSAYHLFAQYRNQGQPVEQDLGVARPWSGGGWTFALPSGLKAVPDGQICMFVGNARGNSSVPVRLQSQPGSNTAHFRYSAWESRVRAATVSESAQRQKAAADAILEQLERDLRDLRALLDRDNVRDPADCTVKDPTASRSASTAMPSDVLPPAAQEGGTQRVCVARARYMTLLKPEYAIDLTALAKDYEADPAVSPADRGKSLARLYLSHQGRWIASVSKGYVPEIGTSRDYLPINKTIVDLLPEYNASAEARTPVMRRVVTLGLLDAYAGCIEDVAKQLKVKYEGWQRATTNKPLRDKLYAERQAEICVGRLKEAEMLADQIAQQRAKSASVPDQAPVVTDRGGASTRRIPLNGESCNL